MLTLMLTSYLAIQLTRHECVKLSAAVKKGVIPLQYMKRHRHYVGIDLLM